jgi:hypothetical protein
MRRKRADFIVKLPNGEYVTHFARFHSGEVPQYTPLQSQPCKYSAQRMSYNVAQAVARKGLGIVCTA